MVNIRGLFNKEVGIIKNENQFVVGKGKIKKGDEFFKWQENAYIVDRLNAYRFEERGLFFKTTYYFYTLKNPTPLRFNTTIYNLEPIIDPEVLSRLLENEVLKALNTVSGGLFGKIKIQHILLGLVVIGVIYYISQGGKLA